MYSLTNCRLSVKVAERFRYGNVSSNMSICAEFGNEFQLLDQDNATEKFYDSYLKLQSVSMILSEVLQMNYHLNLCQF